LIIATLSQLAVPRMIRNVIDAVTTGFISDQILQALDKIPANLLAQHCRRYWRLQAGKCP
jgi:hypothetical protein